MNTKLSFITIVITIFTGACVPEAPPKPNDSVEDVTVDESKDGPDIDVCAEDCAWNYAIEACYHIEGNVDALEKCVIKNRGEGEEWCEEQKTDADCE